MDLTPGRPPAYSGPTMATDRETFKVYLTGTEAAIVREAAGSEAVSGFIRRTLMNSVRPNYSGTDDGVPRTNTTYGDVSATAKAVEVPQDEISRRTGHVPNCECFQCSQVRRFLTPKKEPEKKSRQRGKK